MSKEIGLYSVEMEYYLGCQFEEGQRGDPIIFESASLTATNSLKCYIGGLWLNGTQLFHPKRRSGTVKIAKRPEDESERRFWLKQFIGESFNELFHYRTLILTNVSIFDAGVNIFSFDLLCFSSFSSTLFSVEKQFIFILLTT